MSLCLNRLAAPTWSITDTGVSATDGLTNNLTINVTGLDASRTSWEYSLNGGTTWTTGNNTSFTMVANTTYAINDIQVRQSDARGYGASAKNTAQIIADTTAPTVAPLNILTSTTDGKLQKLAGLATTDTDYVTVVINGATYKITSFDEKGNWTLDLLTATPTSGTLGAFTANTAYTFTTTYTDITGNTSSSVSNTAKATTAPTDMVILESPISIAESEVQPQVKALSNGEYVVAFGGKDVSPNDTDTSVFVQKFSSNGIIESNMVRLEAIDNTLGADITPQVKALPNGEYVVVFQGNDSGTNDSSIFVQKFDSNGVTSGAMVRLEALGNTVGADITAQVTALLNGEFVVTFRGTDSGTNGTDTSIFVQKFNSDGTIEKTVDGVVIKNAMIRLEAIDNTLGADSQPQVTALQNGEFVVTFTGTDNIISDLSIFVQKFNSSGTTSGAMVRLEALDNTLGHDKQPQVTALSNGEFVVTFAGLDSGTNGTDDSVFVQKFDSNGVTSGAMVRLEALDNIAGADITPQVTTLPNGEYVVVFQGTDSGTNGTDNSVYVARFNSDGTVKLKVDIIGTTGDDYIICTNGTVDTITPAGGKDTIINFKIAEDIINLKSLLTGVTGSTSALLAGHLQVSGGDVQGGNVTIKIDKNGGGDGFATTTDIITLVGIGSSTSAVTLDSLVTNYSFTVL